MKRTALFLVGFIILSVSSCTTDNTEITNEKSTIKKNEIHKIKSLYFSKPVSKGAISISILESTILLT